MSNPPTPHPEDLVIQPVIASLSPPIGEPDHRFKLPRPHPLHPSPRKYYRANEAVLRDVLTNEMITHAEWIRRYEERRRGGE